MPCVCFPLEGRKERMLKKTRKEGRTEGRILKKGRLSPPWHTCPYRQQRKEGRKEGRTLRGREEGRKEGRDINERDKGREGGGKEGSAIIAITEETIYTEGRRRRILWKELGKEEEGKKKRKKEGRKEGRNKETSFGIGVKKIGGDDGVKK